MEGVNKSDIQETLLKTLEKQKEIPDSSAFLVDGQQVDSMALLGVLNRLAAREMVTYKSTESERWVLTEEANEIVSLGSHEARVFAAIPSGSTGISIADLNNLGAFAKIGQSQAFKNKWITMKDSILTRAVVSIVDQIQHDLIVIKQTGIHPDQEVLKELKRRKLVDKAKHVVFHIAKGPAFALDLQQLSTDLTFEMVQSSSWKSSAFKNYNFDAAGASLSGGHLHPLLKVREEFRQIFFELGFTEMPTNNYVESSFWNFDTLFQPQQHPSRDAHDTFFLKEPATTLSLPADYIEETRKMHMSGGYGSIGHKCDWKEEEARKNILRTHTTAVSSRMLHRLAKQTPFKPAKYFSIDKVFRNESVDATHLAEFHQIEGVIADYNLSLGDLIGVLNSFFQKLGMTRLRFKPAFNPYTEPSMEIFAFHEGLAKWIEVGNSGVFRPEMLRPMGFDPRVSVIAWGLSLERPTMIKYKVSNIRDLLGHKVDLAMVQSNPICRL